MKKFSKNYLSAIIGFSSLILVWLVWFVAQKTVKNEYLIPSFSQTFNSLLGVLGEGFFWRALGKTLLKVLYSVAISFLLACIFAFIGKIYKPTRAFFKPITAIVRTLPTMAILVLILIYTNSTVAPVVVATLVLFPMIYAQLCVSLDGIDQNIINATKIFKISKRDRLFKIYLPIISPSIFSHIGSNLSFALKVVVSAEVMAYTFTSLGGLMQSANALMDIPRLMALTLIAVLIGLLIEFIFFLINRSLFKWAKGVAKDD